MKNNQERISRLPIPVFPQSPPIRSTSLPTLSSTWEPTSYSLNLVNERPNHKERPLPKTPKSANSVITHYMKPISKVDPIELKVHTASEDLGFDGVFIPNIITTKDKEKKKISDLKSSRKLSKSERNLTIFSKIDKFTSKKRWVTRDFTFDSDNGIVCYSKEKMTFFPKLDMEDELVKQKIHPRILEALVKRNVPPEYWKCCVISPYCIKVPKWILGKGEVKAIQVFSVGCGQWMYIQAEEIDCIRKNPEYFKKFSFDLSPFTVIVETANKKHLLKFKTRNEFTAWVYALCTMVI
ncbi:hypothetical protein ROZALSC1DRAFT_31090 [Rozella allomycis CSF55]|uniref:PH domain-containing protein n=1 Tax=Rozella allomycis (strain CSF55) TaxID=988480 RepID=A0A4P9YD74_ROZAC|nr:hypothetical protein ROZALSC1DRAFT_31090 [Rozella allomycis CSF55]